MTPRIHALLAAALLTFSAAPSAAAPPIPDELLTVAERSDFRATASTAETLAWLERLATRLPEMRLSTFGSSGEGRALPLVVVANDGAFTPELARRSGRAVVLVQSGIHAGEIDGKDATLLLLRDLALGDATLRAVLERVVLVVVPIFNVDGHERVSPYHRATQNGPVEGMGWRATTQGLDLNRDHVKLAAPETRALVRLWNDWRPHLHVDNHVTNGIDHGWRLTWGLAEPPLLQPAMHDWFAPRLAAALAATARGGHTNGPYVDLVDPTDPSRGISSVLDTPRFSINYFALRNRASVLVETNAHEPYRERVLANHVFLRELLREVAADAAGLVAASARADAAARTRAERDERAVLRWKVAPPDRITMPLPSWRTVRSTVTGGEMLATAPPLRDVEVPWQHRLEPDLSVPRPRGYLLLPGWPEVEQRLRDHGLVVEVLAAATPARVETLRVRAPRFATAPLQGRIRVDATVERRAERRELPAGTLWIPPQPDFELAVQLFEPEAPDSLFAWGYLDAVFETKEWTAVRPLERHAEAALARDPSLHAQWEEALRDAAFAADGERRRKWWVERSPWFDETIGMLPVMRAMTPLRDAAPGVSTRPW